MSTAQPQKAYQWVASLYFFQSMPFAVVTLIGTLMYQQYGLKNAQSIFLTSLLTLPWAIKPVFAPLLESWSTKKRLTVLTQLLVSILFLLLAISVNHHYFLMISILGFAGLALISSLHDIVSDGVYLLNLDSQSQKRYVGLRTVFYQLGRLVIKGGLLALMAQLAIYYEINVWQAFFLSLFLMGSLLTLYHFIKLPEIEKKAVSVKENYFLIFKKLLGNHSIYPALIFIFLYNFSEAQMQKIIPVFLLDETGVGLPLSKVGEIYGIAGSLSMMFGVSISAYLLTHFSIEGCIKKLTLLGCLGHLFYLMLLGYENKAYLLYATIIFSQFVAGLVNGAYMSYLLSIANKSDYPMSMYTICTAIMALSYVFFGALSGLVEQYTGYTVFFAYIFIANLLLIVLTYWMVDKHD
ncbi:MFS transporter [Legionella maioricensis]|uniref:MFS transporter n=1 Tax=Legionella maioricensis TaxID=2896528 RepID=A0A9X2IA05_9GAMM|nr:MFS transporter [Legionella maioricensis]MCL9687666.1 MFS transporter [Legionella maioricensis]